MILYSATFKPKGFGIKKYIKIIKTDIVVVSDKKISKRKRRKLEKYITSLSNDRLLNNSHLEIQSYGCFNERDIVLQLCEILFRKITDLSLNDTDGYAAEAVKKYIRKFSTIRIYGSRIYKDIQEQLYLSNGVCIILSNSKIKNSIDTKKILETVKNTVYFSDTVTVSYLDMLKHYGVKILDTAYFNIYNY